MPVALIVAEFGTLNGGERSLLSVLPFLQRRDWRFHALVPEAGPFAHELQASHVVVHPWSNRSDHGERLPVGRLREQIARTLNVVQPTLVHANSLSTSRILGPLATEFPQTGFVGHLRDIVGLNQRNVADLNRLDCLVAVSRATRDWHVRQGLDARRMTVIYNGVDADAFLAPMDTAAGPFDVRQELQLPAACPLVLFAGQIGLRKGLDVWLEAAGRVAARMPQARFLIAGARYSQKSESEEYESRLRQRSREGTLADRVHWLGQRSDMPQLMRQSTVLLHTARQEPLGRVLLEAFTGGLPSVATRVGGTPEIFCDNSLDWLLVDPADASTAAERVTHLLTNRPVWQTTSVIIQAIARSRFSARRAAAELCADLRGSSPAGPLPRAMNGPGFPGCAPGGRRRQNTRQAAISKQAD